MNISVVITCYNIPDFINTCADGILAQTLQPMEVIFVIDGPRDPTVDVIKRRMSEVGYQIPNIIITTSRNKGTAESRNTGIMAASGDVIAFNDGDDWSLPERLEKQLNAIYECHIDLGTTECKEIKASFSNFYHLDERGKFEVAYSYPGNYSTLQNECFVRPNQMVLTEVFEEIGLFNPNFPQAEDYDFWERYLRVYDVAYIDEPLWVYRRHRLAKVSTMDGYIRANEERTKIQNRIKRYLNESK